VPPTGYTATANSTRGSSIGWFACRQWDAAARISTFCRFASAGSTPQSGGYPREG